MQKNQKLITLDQTARAIGRALLGDRSDLDAIGKRVRDETDRALRVDERDERDEGVVETEGVEVDGAE